MSAMTCEVYLWGVLIVWILAAVFAEPYEETMTGAIHVTVSVVWGVFWPFTVLLVVLVMLRRLVWGRGW